MNPEVKKKLRQTFDVNTYKGGSIKPHYKHSGFSLIGEVNALNPSLVVDAGCGRNFFKGYIKNLIGFDQAPYPNIDFQAFIDEAHFEPESVDVLMFLGSLHFGSQQDVYSNFAHAVKWVKPGGYIIIRTMLVSIPQYKLNFYIWTDQDREYMEKTYGLITTKGPFIEHTAKGHAQRLTWWWQKQ